MVITVQFSQSQSSKWSKKTDSLRSLLVSKKNSEKFDVLYELLRENLGSDINYSFELATEAEQLAIELNDSLRIVKAKLAKGVVFTRKDLVNESIIELNQALKISDRNNFESEASKILNFLAIDYSYVGNYDKSLECHFRSLQLNEAKQNKEEIGITYNNIGFVHFKLQDYETAIKYYLKSLEVKKSIQSTFDLDRLYINIALCYNQTTKYFEAEKSIKDGLAICKDNCSPEIKMEANLGLGVSLLHRGKYSESLDFFLSSLAIAREIGQKRFQMENLISIADIKFNQGLDEEAIKLLQEAEQIGSSTQYSYSLIEVYRRLSKVFNKLNDFKLSSEYKEKYISLKDSIYSEELIKNLAKVQTNFAERENIKTIKEKNEVLVLQEKLLEKQRELSAFIVAITLIVLSFAFAFIIFQRKYSKRLKESNLKLEEKVLERTQDLKKTNEKLEKAQGDLRNFLYKTSHDIRGPVATLKGLNNLGFDNLNDLTFTKELLEKKSTQIEKMIRILSRITIVADITNAILEAVEIDFPKLVNDITEFERKNGQLKHIKVSMEVEPNLKVISDPIILRMILENMIDNSLKFFNESKRIEPYVKISVKSVGSDAMILVEDNGVGIEVKPHQDVFTMFMRGSEKSETGGVGLYLCKICTDRLQGTIKLEKTAKTGTTFSIRIAQDATEQIKEMNEALIAQLRKEEPPKIELEEDAPF